MPTSVLEPVSPARCSRTGRAHGTSGRAALAALLLLLTTLLVALPPTAEAAPGRDQDRGQSSTGTDHTRHGTTRETRRARSSRSAIRKAALVPSDPLEVTLTQLTPKVLGPAGPVRVRGTVRNTSDEVWSAINLHAFISHSPISTDLDQALELPADATVGTRITTPGTFDRVDRLVPGASATFQMTIGHQELGITGAPGAYWFGVHALGQNETELRDGFADGRSRTLLPLVDPEAGAQVPATLVLPLTNRVDRDPEGHLEDLDRWESLLSPGGRLDDLLRVSGSTRVPLTWMVDPAVLDAVEQISLGNPAAQLQVVETTPPGEDGSTEPDPSDPASPTATPTTEDSPGVPATDAHAVDAELAALATSWLENITTRLRSTEVLSLPYGDLDVSAATRAGSSLGENARALAAAVLEKFEIAATPVLTAPDGRIRPATLDTDPEAVVLLNSAEVDAAGTGTVIRTHDRQVLLVDDHATTPPNGSDDAAELRQRILSEAALRQQSGTGEPLLMVLPRHWQPTRATSFLRGLDQSWITWESVGQMRLRQPVDVPDSALEYPAGEARQEIPPANFAAASAAISRARLFGRVVDGRSQIPDQVERSVLTQVGTEQRDRSDRALGNIVATRDRVQSLLGRITVEAPNRVILSSDSGQFSSTISNGLDVPIRVRMRAYTDGDLELSTPPTLKIPADSRRTVLLQARTGQTGVHLVTLSITDVRGTPLGQGTSVPVRAAQVSKIVWWLMLGGVLLLVVMSTRRLVERWRRRRLVVPADTDESVADDPAGSRERP